MNIPLNFNSIAQSIERSFLEKPIEEYKVFYFSYLKGFKNRAQVLPALASLCQKIMEISPPVTFILTPEKAKILQEAKTFLNKHFPSELRALYEKDIMIPSLKGKYSNRVDENKFWLSLLATLTETFEELNEKTKQDFHYKRNFLLFIYNCLNNYGLHPNILKRNPSTNKRFNLLLKHYYRSRKELIETKILLSYEEFCKQFINLYIQKKPIKFGGKLIPFAKISEIKISTTFLKEDEIPLYAERNNFRWDETIKDMYQFIHCCQDETETYHPNPFDSASYSKEINLFLIAQTKNFLTAHPKSLRLYEQALGKFEMNNFERNVLDDLRLSLEVLLKDIFKN